MSDSTPLHNLEARVAFQEEAIDQLSNALARQELDLEKMSRMIHHLSQRIRELSDGNPLGEDNQPPPHY
ncbi:SlyX family protein [Nitrincola sp.]|uniref:SlyX family protein n=1 Tax=Nitrincola sp. TaxID=1926584 RepID=UPI003A952713